MNRPTCGQLEQRDAPFTDAAPTIDGQRLRGLIPYSTESRDMGGWTELVEPGALRNADMSELIATVDHAGMPLGRYPTTLHVEDGPNGFQWSVDLPESRSDVREAVERGDVQAGSWRMVVGKDKWVGDTRHIQEIRSLHDVCVAGASRAAYPAAAVEYRTEPEPNPAPESQPAPRQGNLRVEDRAGAGGADRARALGEIETAIVTSATGEVRTLTDSISLAPTLLGQVLFEHLRPAAVMLRSGIRILDMPAGKAITYPSLTADVSPSTYAEGSVITPSDPTFGTVTATARKIATLVQLDNEVLDDSSPAVAPILTSHLLTTLALKLDAQLLEGSGVAPDIKGLKNVPGIQTLPAATNGATPTLDVFADAIALLEALGIQTDEIRIVLHPRNIAALRKAKASTSGVYLWGDPQEATGGQPLFGASWLATSQLSTTEVQGSSNVTNSAYVFSVNQVIYARRSPPEIILDRSRLFNSDQSELRATMRGDLLAPNPNAIVRITGLTV